MRAIPIGDPDYPPRLLLLRTPPERVWVEGPLELDARKRVAIVGTRDPSEAAKAFTRDLARQAAAAGAVVLSGGALGIDREAHDGALDAGRTWVLAPGGVDVDAPTENADLFARVRRQHGTILSCFAPGTKPGLWRFHVRNAMIAALADVLVVVQAGIRSGSLNAANAAKRLGRPIWTSVGPFWDKRFEGTNLLLDQGAHQLTSVDAFLKAVDLTPGNPVIPKQPRGFTLNEGAVFRALAEGPLHLDSVVGRTGLGAPAVATALLTLALEDVVVEGPSGYFRRNST
jgi:DNA processing protein